MIILKSYSKSYVEQQLKLQENIHVHLNYSYNLMQIILLPVHYTITLCLGYIISYFYGERPK